MSEEEMRRWLTDLDKRMAERYDRLEGKIDNLDGRLDGLVVQSNLHDAAIYGRSGRNGLKGDVGKLMENQKVAGMVPMRAAVTAVIGFATIVATIVIAFST